jgi:protease-4
VSSWSHVKQLRNFLIAEKDKKIKAIILRVNSPGGAVGPTQEIYEEVRRIDENEKPVYASFGAVSASGGYYIGAACRKIFANAGALTGSIGVIMNFMNLSKAI